MGRNIKINLRMKDASRDAVLAGALRLFAVRGLSATRMSDIASAAGISQGLAYRHFASKEAIFIELLRQALDRLVRECSRIGKMAAAPAAKLTIAAREFLGAVHNKPNTAWLYMLAAQALLSEDVPAPAKKNIKEKRAVAYGTVLRIIRAGQKDGSIRKYNPEGMALIFWGAVSGLAMYAASGGSGASMPDPDLLSGMFLNNQG